MQYNLGQIFLEANISIAPVERAVSRIEGLYTSAFSKMGSQLTNSLTTGLTAGLSASLSNGIQGGIAQGLQAGLVGGAIAGIGTTVGTAVGSAMEIAIQTRMDIVKSTLTGYSNMLVKGLYDFAEEQKSVNLSTYLVGRKEGWGNESANTQSQLDRDFRSTFDTVMTNVAAELSYSRADIARLGELLVRSGYKSDAVFGRAGDKGSQQNSLLTQTAYLAEAASLRPEEIQQAAKVLKLLSTAYSDQSFDKVANQVLAMYSNTLHPFDTLRYGYQDAAPAAAAAGVKITDMNQVMVMLSSLNTPEVAGTLAKNLFMQIANPTMIDRQINQAIAPAFDNDLKAAGLQTGSGFMPLLREEGQFVETLVKIKETIRAAYETGRLGNLPGQSSMLDGGEAFRKLDEAAQDQRVLQSMMKLFGGSGTLAQALLPLINSSASERQALNQGMMAFNDRDKEGKSATEALIAVKQGGIRGGIDLIQSSIDNVVVGMGRTLEPAFVNFLKFFTDLANDLTPRINLFTGGLERISNTIKNFFSDEDGSKLIAMREAVASTFSTLNRVFENWVDNVFEFLNQENAIENLSKNLNNLIFDVVDGFNNLFGAMKGVLPLINEIAGVGNKFAAKEKANDLEREANSTGKVSEGGMNYAQETGVIGDRKLFPELNASQFKEVAASDEKLIEDAIRKLPAGSISTGRARKGSWYNTGISKDEGVVPVNTEQVEAARANMRQIEGTDYYVSGSLTEENSKLLRLDRNSGRFEVIPNSNSFGGPSGSQMEASQALNKLYKNQQRDASPVDLSTRGLGSFVKPEAYDDTMNSTTLTEEQKKQQLLTMQAYEVKSMFGGQASYDTKTGNITNYDLDALGKQSLLNDPSRFQKIFEVASGEWGVDAQNAINSFLDQDQVKNTDLAEIIKPITSGAITQVDGKSFIYNAETLKAGFEQSGSAQELAQYLVDETQKRASEKTQKILGNPTEEIGNVITELYTNADTKDNKGNFNTFIDLIQEDLNKAKLEARDRGDIEGALEIERSVQQLEQTQRLDASKELQTGIDPGLAPDMEQAQRNLNRYIEERIKLQQEEANLKQKNLELDRQVLLNSSAYRGQINQYLSEYSGLLGSVESSILTNNNKMQTMMEELRIEQQNLFEKLKGIGFKEQDYRGFKIGVPDAAVNDKDNKYVTEQQARIDAKLGARAQLAEQNKSNIELLGLQIQNLIEKISTAAQEAFQSIFNSLQIEGGAASGFSNKAASVIDGVFKQAQGIAQQIQALNSIKATTPDKFSEAQAKQLAGFEELFNKIPESLDSALKDLVESFKLDMSRFFQEMVVRQQQRTSELLGMTGSGVVGSVTKLVGLADEIQNQIFSNNQEIAKLNLEDNGLARQAELYKVMAQFTDIGAVAEKLAFTQAALDSNQFKKEALGEENKVIQDFARDKADLGIYNTTSELIDKTKGIRSNMSSDSFNRVDSFYSRLNNASMEIAELESAIQMLEKVYQDQVDNFGDMSLVQREHIEQLKNVVQAQKEAAEEIKKIKIAYELEKLKLTIENLVRGGQSLYSQNTAEYYGQMAQLTGSQVGFGFDVKAGKQREQQILANEQAQLTNLDSQYNTRLAELATQRDLNIKSAKAGGLPKEAQVQLDREQDAILNEIAQLEYQKTEKARQIRNATQVELANNAPNANALLNAERKLAENIKSAFETLYDTLTDESKSLGERMKDFGKNLMKQIGKIGWDWLMGQITDKLTGNLTKPKAGLEAPGRAPGQIDGQLEFGNGTMPALQTQEFLDKLDNLREQLIANQEKYADTLAKRNQEFNTKTASMVSVSGNPEWEQFTKLIKDSPNKDFLFNASLSGIDGVAQAAVVQVELQSQMVNTLNSIDQNIGKIANNGIPGSNTQGQPGQTGSGAPTGSPQGQPNRFANQPLTQTNGFYYPPTTMFTLDSNGNQIPVTAEMVSPKPQPVVTPKPATQPQTKPVVKPQPAPKPTANKDSYFFTGVFKDEPYYDPAKDSKKPPALELVERVGNLVPQQVPVVNNLPPQVTKFVNEFLDDRKRGQDMLRQNGLVDSLKTVGEEFLINPFKKLFRGNEQSSLPGRELGLVASTDLSGLGLGSDSYSTDLDAESPIQTEIINKHIEIRDYIKENRGFYGEINKQLEQTKTELVNTAQLDYKKYTQNYSGFYGDINKQLSKTPVDIYGNPSTTQDYRNYTQNYSGYYGDINSQLKDTPVDIYGRPTTTQDYRNYTQNYSGYYGDINNQLKDTPVDIYGVPSTPEDYKNYVTNYQYAYPGLYKQFTENPDSLTPTGIVNNSYAPSNLIPGSQSAFVKPTYSSEPAFIKPSYSNQPAILSPGQSGFGQPAFLNPNQAGFTQSNLPGVELGQVASTDMTGLLGGSSNMVNLPYFGQVMGSDMGFLGGQKSQALSALLGGASPQFNPAGSFGGGKAIGYMQGGLNAVNQFSAGNPMGGIGSLLGMMGGNWSPILMGAMTLLPLLFGTGSKVKRYNSGVTKVPGNGNHDSVPSLLMPGEAVLTKAAVTRLGGEEFINKANMGTIDRYSVGGMVRPKNLGMRGIKEPSVPSITGARAIEERGMTPEQREIRNFQEQQNQPSSGGGRQELAVKLETVSIGGQEFASVDQVQQIADRIASQKVNSFGKKFSSSPGFRRGMGLA